MTLHGAEYSRKSQMRFNEIYFWTATINQWQCLLSPDRFKEIVIQSLEYLSLRSCIEVFGFVIMPNHVHFIWRMLKLNGKETPQGSFLKFTAHEFKKMLLSEPEKLACYEVQANNKRYEFWHRDSLAIPLFTEQVAFQKLNYLHSNPLQDRWRLVVDPCDYKFSSARFYKTGDGSFPFLRNLGGEF